MLIVAFILYECKLAPLKAISLVVICVLGTQLACYNVFLVKGNTFDPVRYDQYNYISDKIKENYESGSEGYYYRIKDYDDAISNAAALTTHTNCFSVFSSVIDAKNLAPTNFFGYDGNKINCIKSSGGLFFGDALLGYKYYYIHNDSYKNQELSEKYKRPYNVLLDDTVQPYFQGMRNELCFPNAFVTFSGDLVFDGSYFDNLEKLYRFLGGEGELFDKYEVKLSDVSEANGIFTVKVRTKDEGQWYLLHEFSEDLELRFVNSAYDDERSKPLTRDTVVNYGYHKKSESIYYYSNIKVCGGGSLTKEDVAAATTGLCLPLEKIRALKSLLDGRAAEYKIVGGNKFVVKADAETDDAYLFMNYVALDGFKVKVNGKDAQFIDNGLNFMIVKLDEGANEVTIAYSSPYIKYALFGVFAAIAVAAAVFFLNRAKGRIRAAAENVTFVSAIALSLLVAGFFIVYPTSLFLVKLFRILL